MRNIKTERNLTGKNFWPRISYVDVQGVDSAKQRDRSVSESAQEEVIQSWLNIAVLKASPRTDFKFGYIQGNSFEFLCETIETDPEGQFGVRVGDKDTRFFILPTDLSSTFSLELVKITDETDPDFTNLPLY